MHGLFIMRRHDLTKLHMMQNAQTKRLAISEHVCEVLFVAQSSARLTTPQLDAK
jgi:hypothetical protein